MHLFKVCTGLCSFLIGPLDLRTLEHRGSARVGGAAALTWVSQYTGSCSFCLRWMFLSCRWCQASAGGLESTQGFALSSSRCITSRLTTTAFIERQRHGTAHAHLIRVEAFIRGRDPTGPLAAQLPVVDGLAALVRVDIRGGIADELVVAFEVFNQVIPPHRVVCADLKCCTVHHRL